MKPLLMAFVLMQGCSDPKIDAEVAAENHRIASVQEEILRKSIDLCFKAGAIPIFSSWDGSLKECKKP